MTDAMVLAKRKGIPFETAWRGALLAHQPRSRDMGPERPTLFESDGEEPVTQVEFLRRACFDAWNGNRPALRHFTPGLLGTDEHQETVRRLRPGQGHTRSAA